MRKKLLPIIFLLVLAFALPALAAPLAWATQGVFDDNPKGDTQLRASKAIAFIALNKRYVVCKQENQNYIVFYDEDNEDFFTGANAPKTPVFRIEKDSRHRTRALYIYANGESGPVYRVYANKDTKALMFACVGSTVKGKANGDILSSSSKEHKRLEEQYYKHFEKDLGLSAFNEGNILKDQDWVEIAERDDVTATVEIKAKMQKAS